MNVAVLLFTILWFAYATYLFVKVIKKGAPKNNKSIAFSLYSVNTVCLVALNVFVAFDL